MTEDEAIERIRKPAQGSASAVPEADPVEQALARALELASAAGRWADVGLLARELEARRRDRAYPVT